MTDAYISPKPIIYLTPYSNISPKPTEYFPTDSERREQLDSGAPQATPSEIDGTLLEEVETL